MVLFREDEKHIKEIEKQEKLAKRTKLGFWVRRFIKVSIVLGIIFGISLALLAGLGGSHAALKKGIEDYLTQASGLQAEIGEFNHMGFFPNLELDAADITFRKDGVDAPVITIEKAIFSAGFFDLMLSRQRIEALNVENIFVAAGVIGDKKLMIKNALLDEKEGDAGAALIVAGNYGEENIVFHMDMERDGGVFKLPDSSDFKIGFGDFQAQGKTERVKWGGVKLHIDELGLPENIFSGDVIIKKRLFKNKAIAEFSFGESQFYSDVKISRNYMKGIAKFPVLALDDIEMLAQLYGFLEALPTKKSDGLIDLYGLVIDLDVVVESLHAAKGTLGDLDLNVAVKNQTATMSFGGDLNSGKLSGAFILNAETLPAALKIQADLKKWDYGQYQKAMFGRENVSGDADIHIAVNASGKSYTDIMESLKGEATLVAGRGEMASSALNIWGSGLVNALLPSLDSASQTTLNCMIANFKIEDSIAKPDPLFIDTQRVTVIGEGEINLFKNNIDLKLEPKAKDPAFLDVATAVNIKGSILNPSIGADTFSIFEKIGGLALGLVNPAFLVLSMTDMGVTENHPCYEFIGKPEGEKEQKLNKAENEPVQKKALNE